MESRGRDLLLGLSMITCLDWLLIQYRETIIISASETYWQAHSIENANSVIYRRRSGEKWQMISEGLPTANGTIISILASNPSNSEEFYAINNRGIFRSSNSGISWRALDVDWPKEYLLQHPRALVVVDSKGWNE